MKKNTVANILFILGIVIIVIGFISGLSFGRDDLGYGTQIIWSVVLLYWLSSFISGMILIGIAEIIEILDTKLSWIQRRMSNGNDVENIPSSFSNNGNKVESKVSTDRKGPVSKQDENFLRDYFLKKDIAIQKIINTPFVGICLVQFLDDNEKMYDIDGFSPEEVPYEKLNVKMKEWFDAHTKRETN